MELCNIQLSFVGREHIPSAANERDHKDNEDISDMLLAGHERALVWFSLGITYNSVEGSKSSKRLANQILSVWLTRRE